MIESLIALAATFGSIVNLDQTVTFIHRPGYDEQRQELIQSAYNMTNGDMDFIATIECESNRRWNIQSEVIDDKGIREQSYGLCQRNSQRYGRVPQHEMYNDPYRQLSLCYDQYQLWRHAGVLHKQLKGWNRRETCKENFEVTQTTIRSLIFLFVREEAINEGTPDNVDF